MHHLVFDVESLGVGGPSVAWGAVLFDATGEELLATGCCRHRDEWAALALAVDAPQEDLTWAEQHVNTTGCEIVEGRSIYDKFYLLWNAFRTQEVVGDHHLWADVPFPCETRFLSMLKRDDQPYPLLDVASVLYAAGMDPLGTYDRLPSELPRHNPINDARQSGRMLFEALVKIRQKEI